MALLVLPKGSVVGADTASRNRHHALSWTERGAIVAAISNTLDAAFVQGCFLHPCTDLLSSRFQPTGWGPSFAEGLVFCVVVSRACER